MDLADEEILNDLAQLQMEAGIVADESLPEELDRQVRRVRRLAMDLLPRCCWHSFAVHCPKS